MVTLACLNLFATFKANDNPAIPDPIIKKSVSRIFFSAFINLMANYFDNSSILSIETRAFLLNSGSTSTKGISYFKHKYNFFIVFIFI